MTADSTNGSRGIAPATVHDAISHDLVFWDGRNPQFDASIVMTAYQAKQTLDEAISSIFSQEVDTALRVQLIIGVDPSSDGTLELARKLTRSPPSWLTVECFENDLPNLVLHGRRTARTNFLNCYSRIRGSIVLFLNCDDAWLSKTKLQAQINFIRRKGRACCTAIETVEPHLERLNRVAKIRNPFRYGNSILTSSFAMPYIHLENMDFWWTCPFLDWPLVCLCLQRFGIVRLLGERTFYRINESGAWASTDLATRRRLTKTAAREMISSGLFSPLNRYRLLRYIAFIDEAPKRERKAPR